MLVLGVPEYRLPREIIRAEIEAIKSLGVKIVLNTRLGVDFTLPELKRQGFPGGCGKAGNSGISAQARTVSTTSFLAATESATLEFAAAPFPAGRMSSSFG